MRVIFTSFAVEAHFLGQVPLAWALRAAGHEVRVASQPALVETITSAGLTAVPVGEEHGWFEAMAGADGSGSEWNVTADLDPIRPEVHQPAFLEYAQEHLISRFIAPANNESLIEGLVGFARAWRPDLVIWEPFTVAGAIAAEAVGAAHARLLWGADLFMDQRRAFLAEPARKIADPLASWFDGVLGPFDLAFHEQLVRGHWTIDQVPSSVRIPLGEPTVPMRYVPYNGPAVVPDWLREAPQWPRVCLTAGITARTADYLKISLSDLIDGLAELPVEVVATLDTEQRDQLGILPDNVRTAEFLPLHALLPTCSAIVHHGGAGTWATASVCGVPQLIVPKIWDNPYRARRTAEIGAALVVPSAEITGAGVRDGVRRLLDDPKFSTGADRLRREMLADPSPSDVVPQLEKLTITHQGLGS